LIGRGLDTVLFHAPTPNLPHTFTRPSTRLHQTNHAPSPNQPRAFTSFERNYTKLPQAYTYPLSSAMGIVPTRNVSTDLPRFGSFTAILHRDTGSMGASQNFRLPAGTTPLVVKV
jgi:hypothetical protein